MRLNKFWGRMKNSCTPSRERAEAAAAAAAARSTGGKKRRSALFSLSLSLLSWFGG